MARPCPLCAGESFDPIDQDGKFETVRCGACSLVFVDPLPTMADMEVHYDDDTYYEEWATAQADRRERLWKTRIGWVQETSKGGRLLDVGCAEGEFLEAAKGAGFEVVGTELSASAIEAAKKKDLDARAGTLESMEFEDATFDVVTMWHVLEHVPDPIGTLKEIFRILKPAGVLHLAVPNAANGWFRFVYTIARRKRYRYFTIADKEWHVFHFTPTTLGKVLEAAGFEVERQGLDAANPDRKKGLADLPARWFGSLFGVNRSSAQRAVARKPG